MFDHWTEKWRKSSYMKTYVCILKAHSHSIEWRFNLIFPSRSLPFLSSCRASSHILRYDTNPPAIREKQWHSRKAQIEPVFFECKWVFMIRASVLTNSQYSLWEYKGGNRRFTSERWLVSCPCMNGAWPDNYTSTKSLIPSFIVITLVWNGIRSNS